MNTAPYQNDETRLIARLVLDADKVKSDAEQWQAKLVAARAVSESAEAVFVASLSEGDAYTVATEKARVAHLTAVVTAIENVGGADGLRARALDVPSLASLLVRAFEIKREALCALLVAQRKSLAGLLAKLTDEGIGFPAIEGDVAVSNARGRIQQTEAARDLAAIMITRYGPNWRPGNTTHKVSEAIGTLQQPLPV
jgi:hypothetical protein